MRFCVLGHRGLLGATVTRYLREQGHEVFTLNARFSLATAPQFVEDIIKTQPDWCINCIGKKPPSDRNMLWEVNGHLPSQCSSRLPDSIGFIHASSDAIFRPDIPFRTAEEAPDARDLYGSSKAYGEHSVVGPRRISFRCSFIGIGTDGSGNLLSWFIHSPHEAVTGYINHAWNGITSLEWAKVALATALDYQRGGRIVQLGTHPAVSKYELLRMIRGIWSCPVRVVPGNANESILRTLVPNAFSPPLIDQMRELKNWNDSQP